MVKTYRVFTGAPKFTSTNDSSSELVEHGELTKANSIYPDNQSQSYFRSITFQGESQEESLEINSGYKSMLHEKNLTISFLRVNDRTYRTNESYEGSTMLSEGSSVSRFPTFNFSLDHITSLSSLMSTIKNQKLKFVKVNLLVSILEVDGPVYVTSKNKNNSEEMALLKLMIGDDGGQICKLVVWRETAEIWGGLSSNNNSVLKRGDVVCFENVVINNAAILQDAPLVEFIASPSHKSSAQICYRTIAVTKEDLAFRPDLRLAYSIPSVRRVSQMVEWMQSAGYA